MKVEQYQIAKQWLEENEDKWHLENDEPVWDVPIDQIPDLVQQFFIERKERQKQMLERIRIRKGLKI